MGRRKDALPASCDGPIFAALRSSLDAEVAAERLGQKIRPVEAEVPS